MRRILAIAGLAVKVAIRSKLFVTMAVILFVVVGGLPLSIKGDGTLRGQISLLLYYSLGLSVIVIGAASLWTACWSIAREVEDKNIQMLVVKPVHRMQIWLGKWLGILFINAVLLAITGVLVMSAVKWKISSSDAGSEEMSVLREEVLNSRRRIPARRKDYAEEAHVLMEELLEAGEFVEGTPHDVAYEYAYKRIAAAKATVAPGETKSWIFDIEKAPPRHAEVRLRYHLTMFARKRYSVSGVWLVGTKEEPDIHREEVGDLLGGGYLVAIPAEMVVPGRELVVTFRNLASDNAHSAVFSMRDDLEILVNEGTFVGNYLRTLVIMFCHLALLAALGLAMSAVFTFPVATFAAVSILAISLAGYYFTTTIEAGHEHVCGCGHCEQEENALTEFMEPMARGVGAAIAPAMRFQPLGLITDGIMVSPRMTAEGILLLLVLYPGMLWLFSGYVLNRRELALPM